MPTDADVQTLATAARAATAHAYCPYSRFAVGAAVRTADGRVFTGCNVENASFGLSICAERNAVFQAVAAGARDMLAIAIYTPTAAPVTPCGACRQVIAEFARDCVVTCHCDGPGILRLDSGELLPHSFGLPPAG